MAALSFELGEWLPDNPPVVNPAFPPQTEAYFSGGRMPLQTAKNVVWQDSCYRPFLPLSTATALPATCLGAYTCYDTTGAIQLFAGTATKLYKLVTGAWTDVSRLVGGAYTATHWEFAAYGDTLVATNGTDAMQSIGITSGANFAALDTSGTDLIPTCQTLGVVRDFMIAGNTVDSTNGAVPSNIQWSQLANVASWPVPNTQSAYANQAGAQLLYQEYGSVVGIGENEGFGLVFQDAAITRMTYVGGAQVFDFQTIDKAHGCIGRKAFCRIGNIYYFVSRTGLCATDGSSIREIGEGKFNKYLRDNINSSYASITQVIGDAKHNCVYIAFQNGASSLDSLLCYNYADDRATLCLQNSEMYFQYLSGNILLPGGFDTTHKYGTFSGTPGTATFTSQDIELNPGGRSLMTAVRPLVEGSATVATGATSDLNTAVSLGPYVATDSRTLRSPQRTEGLFHAISMQIIGSFTAAIGVTIWSEPSGGW